MIQTRNSTAAYTFSSRSCTSKSQSAMYEERMLTLPRRLSGGGQVGLTRAFSMTFRPLFHVSSTFGPCFVQRGSRYCPTSNENSRRSSFCSSDLPVDALAWDRALLRETVTAKGVVNAAQVTHRPVQPPDTIESITISSQLGFGRAMLSP